MMKKNCQSDHGVERVWAHYLEGKGEDLGKVLGVFSWVLSREKELGLERKLI